MSNLMTDNDRDVAHAARGLHATFKRTPLRMTGGAGLLDMSGSGAGGQGACRRGRGSFTGVGVCSSSCLQEKGSNLPAAARPSNPERSLRCAVVHNAPVHAHVRACMMLFCVCCVCVLGAALLCLQLAWSLRLLKG